MSARKVLTGFSADAETLPELTSALQGSDGGVHSRVECEGEAAPAGVVGQREPIAVDGP